MALDKLKESLLDGLEQEGFFNLSFWGDDSLSTVSEVTEASQPYLVQGKVRVSRLRDLWRLQYEPYPSDPWPHITVRFEGEPSDTVLEELVSVFGDPVPNEHRQR